MADLADELRTEATNIINEFGSDVTLQKIATNVYDIATSKTITTPGATIALKAHIQNFDSSEIGALIFAGDVKLIVAWRTDVTYAIDTDKVIIDSVEYNIININPIIAQNKTITNELQLRK